MPISSWMFGAVLARRFAAWQAATYQLGIAIILLLFWPDNRLLIFGLPHHSRLAAHTVVYALGSSTVFTSNIATDLHFVEKLSSLSSSFFGGWFPFEASTRFSFFSFTLLLRILFHSWEESLPLMGCQWSGPKESQSSCGGKDEGGYSALSTFSFLIIYSTSSLSYHFVCKGLDTTLAS